MIYFFDDHELNTDTQELSSDGEPVHVEPQVLAVLEYLLTHRDRVVTKIELLDAVWGDRFVSESALTSRIKSVRSACNDNGRDQRVVRTVHGRGYRFVAHVLERDATHASVPPKPPAPPVPVTTPGAGFVGRTAELDRLVSALGAAASDQRQAVFLTGEVGVGKSAILAELLEGIDDRWQVMPGQCLRSRGTAEPYFCLLDALTRLSRADGADVVGVLEHVAPSWLAAIPSLFDDETAGRLQQRLLGSTPERMLREGADAIEELARIKPMVLALEDLQWADDYTLDVLELLLQRTEPLSLLLVGTMRVDPSPASELIAAMARGGRASELQVRALERAAIVALVTDRFDGASVSDELLDMVALRCDGIPLFAQEILATWIRNDLVGVEANEVRVRVPIDQLAATVPDGVRQLIERQLADLDPADVAVLEAAAVAGMDFEGAAVAAALGQPLSDVEAVLSTISRQLNFADAQGGSSWPDGTVSTKFSFAHELHRQVIYERISAASRARLHAGIGDAIESSHIGHLATVTVTLAHHFVQAGNSDRAIEYLRRAGEQAADRSAFSYAEGFLFDALARVEDQPSRRDRDRSELQIRMALGPTLVATRGWFGEEVLENYQRAMELCESRDSCSEAALARYGLATVTELRGEYPRTEQLLLPLLGDTTDDLGMETRELMACSMFHQGAFQRSFDNARTVLDSWEQDDYSVLMSRLAEHPASACNSWASLSSWYLGRSDESLQLAAAAVQIGEQNLYALSTARVQCAFLHQFRDEPALCGEWADQAMELADHQGFPMRALQATIIRGWVDAAEGSPDEGVARIAIGLDRYRSLRARLSEPYFIGLHADAELFAGRPDRALRLLDEAVLNMNETTRSFFFDPELHRLRARAHSQIGGQDAVTAAREALDHASTGAELLRSPPLALRAAIDRLRLEAQHGDPEPWREPVAMGIAHYEGQADTVDVVAARSLLDA